MKKKLALAIAVVVAGMALLHLYFSDRGRFTTEPMTTGWPATCRGTT